MAVGQRGPRETNGKSIPSGGTQCKDVDTTQEAQQGEGPGSGQSRLPRGTPEPAGKMGPYSGVQCGHHFIALISLAIL